MLTLNPYSVNMIVLKKKPKEPEAPVAEAGPLPQAAGNITKQ